MWPTASQLPKISNPKIEEAFACTESYFGDDSIAKLLPDDILVFLLNVLTTLLKFVVYSLQMCLPHFTFNHEITLVSIDCNDGHASDATNLQESDLMRGPNKPPKKSTIQYQPSGTKHYDESNVKSFKDNDMDDNYSHNSYCATTAVPQTTTLPTTCPTGLLLNHNNFAGEDCEGDNPHAASTVQSIHQADPCNANLFQNNSIGSNDFLSNSNQIVPKHPIPGCSTVNHKTASMYSVSMPQALKTVTPLNTADGFMETPVKSTPQKAAEHPMVTPCSDGYKKPTYVVLVGDTVRKCNTKLYSSLPLRNKFMVKQRVQDSTGATRIKLVLKSGHERYSYKIEIYITITILVELTL